MTDNEIRVAIAEACGWTQIDDHSENLMMAPGFLLKGYPPKNQLIGRKEELPDYPNDLNAMHEAEKNDCNNFGQSARIYEFELRRIVRLNPIWHATARQRAEAFLRTIGKWQDTPVAPTNEH